MERIALIGLLRIELPEATVRLCDGGFIAFGEEPYQAKDAVFGTIGSIQSLTEGIGEEIPALELTLLPAGTSAPAQLSQPGFQRSIVQMWVGEYDQALGQLIGAPDLIFHGQIDQTTLTVGRQTRELGTTVVSTAERFFAFNEGNSLNPTFHKSVWPGELGENNATGLTVPVAWGTEAAPTASGSSVGGNAWRAGVMRVQ